MQGGSCRYSRLRYKFPFAVEVVNQQVLAEVVPVGIEGATVVDLRHLIDEGNHPIVIIEHEGVDSDAVAGAALHLQ